MLNFDLSDTRAGEELIDMGLQKGRQELLYTMIFNRFGRGLTVNKESLADIDGFIGSGLFVGLG
jgi:hypothetical protein